MLINIYLRYPSTHPPLLNVTKIISSVNY